MARKRKKGSTSTFGGIGLEKHEDEKLIALLKLRDSSLSRLIRVLVRGWIRDHENELTTPPTTKRI